MTATPESARKDLPEALRSTMQALHYDLTRRNPVSWKALQPIIDVLGEAAAAIERLAEERDALLFDVETARTALRCESGARKAEVAALRERAEALEKWHKKLVALARRVSGTSCFDPCNCRNGRSLCNACTAKKHLAALEHQNTAPAVDAVNKETP